MFGQIVRVPLWSNRIIKSKGHVLSWLRNIRIFQNKTSLLVEVQTCYQHVYV